MRRLARRSLGHLADTPQTADEESAPAWPRPPRVGAAPVAPRRARGARAPLPVDPGRWGRAPSAPRASLPPWVPIGAPPAPPPALPPPIPPGRRSPARRRGRRPGRGVVIEMAVALAILLAVALASTGGGPRAAPASSSALVAWGRGAVPVITSLVDDLGSIESDTAHPANVAVVALRADFSTFETDLVTAQHLSEPPAAAIRTTWTATLSQLTAAARTLGAAVTTLDPAAVAVTHQRVATAGAGLLQIGRSLAAGGEPGPGPPSRGRRPSTRR